MKSIAKAIIVLIPLAACSGEAANAASAKDAVRLLLADPGSAEFEAIGSRDGVTCGLVNAKNSHGGYAGKQGFVVSDGQAVLDNGQPDFSMTFSQKCPVETSIKYHEIEAARIHQKVDEITGQLNAPNP